MLLKPKQCAAAATQTSTRRLTSQPLDDTRSVFQNAEHAAGRLPGVSIAMNNDIINFSCGHDSITTLLADLVCRVCLGRDVRLYDMWQRGLSAMYARVVGVQINTEDKLPRQLCWECVGRLSSANRFIQKALKTQWIFKNKTNKRLVTISDIESIDKAQGKLESTLGIKLNTVNEYDFLFTEETEDANNDCNEDIEVDTIKTEEVVVDVQDYTTDFIGAGIDDEAGDAADENLNISNKEQAISIKQESTSDEEVAGDDESVSEMSQEGRQVVDKSSEACEVIKLSHKGSNYGLSPMSNQRSKVAPGCKELVVLLEDIGFTIYNTEHSSKQAITNADQSTRHTQKMENKFRTPIRNRIIFEEEDLEEEDLDMVREISAECKETVKPPQSVVNAPGSTSRNINADTSVARKRNKLILSDTEYPQKLFICDVCDKSFDHKSALILHIERHPKMHYCTHCSYKTYKKSNLASHVNSKHTKSIFFNCPHCSYKTFIKACLAKHVNAIHTKKLFFNCTHCSYKTFIKARLVRHVNAKHTKSKFSNCPHCSYKTYRKSHLARHVKATHTKNIFFNCTHCSYKAYRKSHLVRHVNAKHTKSEFFSCTHCSYKAYRKSHLVRHVNAKHTKSEFFSCPHCSYKAFRKINLSMHVNAKHTKNIFFNCPHCSYKTYEKSALPIHVNGKHTKSAVFNCAHCSFKSYFKANLLRHVKLKHAQ